MIAPGYLHNWIRSNYKRLWPGRDKCPRFMGKNAILCCQQHHFFEFGKMLIARMNKALDGDKQIPFQFAILNLEEVGAWVVRSPECYGVLISKKLLWKIQRICYESWEAIPETFDMPVKRSNFLRDLWGDMPLDSDYLMHFSTLVGHVAFSFIVHHEVAHAGLGHLKPIHRQGVNAEVEADSLEDVILDEFAGVMSNKLDSGDYLLKQALETDADVHGMFYTRRLLREEAQSLRGYRPNGNLMSHVWGKLLRDKDCEQLMLFMGVAVGLLALAPDLEADKFDISKLKTHPPIPSRLLLAFHVAGSIDGHAEKYWENRSAAITMAIISIARFQGEGFRDPSANTRAKDNYISENNQELSVAEQKWRELSYISVIDASFRMSEIGSYWEDLVACLCNIAPDLSRGEGFPESLHYEWYRSRGQDK
ncbi:hypothetical protein [Azospirillum sp. B2RO_4]|uniref:hypothetical protein n=1 Tax=Azospirillum sp. B2RO_4 TaxID=3027796 RepID=UPI003DA80356